MIGIVNYGSGNVGAIANIYKQLKLPCFVSGNPEELRRADRYILPGVGAFDSTMDRLGQSGLTQMLGEQVADGKPVLGICVGMQILGNSSEEGTLAGLGWIDGVVRRIPDSPAGQPLKRLPHMGWNSIRPVASDPLFDGIDLERGFYFLHNYHFDCTLAEDVAAYVNYGGDLVCAVKREKVIGLQFHPEKSHSNGVAIFRNFASY